MALIKCSECGKEISDKAKTCIHCGCPVEKKQNNNRNIRKIIIGIIIFGLSLIIILWFGKNILKLNIFNSKNDDSNNYNNDIIIGEWFLSAKNYFEFFDDNTFEYTCYSNTCPSDMLEQTDAGGNHKTCFTKGTYELKNEKSIYLYPTNSTCDIKSEYVIWSFSSDYTYFCANTGGVCFGGWQQASKTPYHLNIDGTRIK